MLDLQFLDAYLPSQPNLLCALTIIGFISFLTFAFFLLYFIARHFGICSFYDSDVSLSFDIGVRLERESTHNKPGPT